MSLEIPPIDTYKSSERIKKKTRYVFHVVARARLDLYCLVSSARVGVSSPKIRWHAAGRKSKLFLAIYERPGFPISAIAVSDRLTRSCVKHLLVAASSRRTAENVASRSGSGKHCRRASRALALSLSLCMISQLETRWGNGQSRPTGTRKKKSRRTSKST